MPYAVRQAVAVAEMNASQTRRLLSVSSRVRLLVQRAFVMVYVDSVAAEHSAMCAELTAGSRRCHQQASRDSPNGVESSLSTTLNCFSHLQRQSVKVCGARAHGRPLAHGVPVSVLGIDETSVTACNQYYRLRGWSLGT